MDKEAVTQVRRFNRVTERIGALNDRFLARDRPLGEARVLWEIGEHGRDVKSLRSHLGLDSGYLSRMLRSLETAGMVTVRQSPADRRVRFTALTSKEAAERALLDERSDDFAAALLTDLDAHQRDRLLRAMSDVERLLTASLVQVDVADPRHVDARHCMSACFDQLAQRSTRVEDARREPDDDDALGHLPVFCWSPGCVGLRSDARH